MKTITVTQAAARLGLSTRRVRLLCAQGRIPGAKLVPGVVRPYYILPADCCITHKDAGRPKSP